MCSSDSMYRETISLPLPQVSSSHRQESRRCWRQEGSGESSAVTITGMESLSPRDIRHVFSHPPRPSLQTSSNELPAPATTPHTCSPTPAQYSPLSPHQPSPPPPPQPSPPPPSQPSSTEHFQPTSSPSSVETSPQVAIEIDTEIEVLLPQSASVPNNSPNISDVHRLPQHSRIASPAATTTTASNHPMPTPTTCHSAPSLCSLLLQPPASQCTQHPNPYSSTCTPASEAITCLTSRTMLNSTPANQSRNTTRLVSTYNTPIVCYD